MVSCYTHRTINHVAATDMDILEKMNRNPDRIAEGSDLCQHLIGIGPPRPCSLRHFHYTSPKPCRLTMPNRCDLTLTTGQSSWSFLASILISSGGFQVE